VFKREYDVRRAVDGVSFSIERGEAVGYVGPNGAGKSTTIKILTGILVPTAGVAQVSGLVPHLHRTERARRMGVVFGQRSQLWWDLPLEESFALHRHIYRVPPDRFRKTLAFCEELLGVGEFRRFPVRQLSLGAAAPRAPGPRAAPPARLPHRPRGERARAARPPGRDA
jgi:ABC-2 type transport system ATP-binding protein